MQDFLEQTPEATAWIDAQRSDIAPSGCFGKLVGAVVWLRASGQPVVGPDDPTSMIDEINREGWPLLNGHDPGKPAGRVLAARLFVAPNGARFVAAVLGLYTPEVVSVLQDSDLDAEPQRSIPIPHVAPENCTVILAVDPREVDDAWTQKLCADPSLRVSRLPLSNNADIALHELVRVALPIGLLLWTPFAKKIGEEAGRDVYATVRNWLRRLIESAKELKDPLICLDTHSANCQLTFILRHKDIQTKYAAIEAVSEGVQRGHLLVDRLTARGLHPTQAVYEFDAPANKWYPSYVALHDGRLIAKSTFLIAVEQVGTELSIGIADTTVARRSGLTSQ